MVYKCPTCAAALYYSPQVGRLKCKNCSNTYKVDELETEEQNNTIYDETVEWRIYTCTSCGAKLGVNQVEVSTFCMYCGQPTIVFEQVSTCIKPQYIIPFSVTQKEAVVAIKKYIKNAMFVPDEIKNLDSGKVRGIYIPYWVYDLFYCDRQYFSGEAFFGFPDNETYYYREAECKFENVALDASQQLNDEVSKHLEPFDLQEIKPFDSAYLTGFYADCFDVPATKLWPVAFKRMKKYFDKEIEKTILAKKIRIEKNCARHKLLDKKYVLLPVWFMTTRIQDKPYTLLVNGQTGKATGAIPFDKLKLKRCILWMSFILSVLAFPVLFPLFRYADISFSVCVMVISFLLCYSSYKKVKEIASSVDMYGSKGMEHFVHDRQEGDSYGNS